MRTNYCNFLHFFAPYKDGTTLDSNLLKSFFIRRGRRLKANAMLFCQS